MDQGKTAQNLGVVDLVILAGGAATRLGSLTGGLPKALMPVGGLPFMALQVAEMARTATIRRVIVAARKGTESHFTDFAKGFEYPVVVVEENAPLGTGGAILSALDVPSLSDPFIVANGDVLFRMDLTRLTEAARAQGAALAAINVPDAGRFGAVMVEGGKVSRFMEKGITGPGLVSAGLYAFTHNSLKRFAKTACSFETDMAPILAHEGQLASVPMNGPFIDIGTPATLASADGFAAKFAS